MGVKSEPVSDNMIAEEQRMREEAEKEEQEDRKRSEQWNKANKKDQQNQYSKLMHLVQQSTVFASIMQQRMQQDELKRQQKQAAEQKKVQKQGESAGNGVVNEPRRITRQADGNQGKERELPSRSKTNNKNAAKSTDLSNVLKKDEVEAQAGGVSVSQAVAEAAKDYDGQGGFGAKTLRSADQPKAVTGGIMRSYQLEGLYWLRSLYENGLNGILADEMGLGKTIQTISFLAFLREMQSYGPFLVVAPLSTLTNWIDEFARWTPEIKTILYHGTPAEREEMRRMQLKKPGTEEFPVVCTSYEICMNDRKYLSHYGWKFIIIDEGHRLKNLNCRLIKELKQYRSANRLLITGTPLQNNLAELWSLLNFLMPEVFDTLENFESFFDFSAVLEKGGHKQIIEKEAKSNLVASLHAILKPFLLRRVKTDVETDLPKKREYILYAPLTPPQKELYKQILEGNSRSYLENQVVESLREAESEKSRNSTRKRSRNGSSTATTTPNKSVKSSRSSTPASIRSSRKSKRKNYTELSDDEYFNTLDSRSASESEPDEEAAAEIERAATLKLAKQSIANKKLQNPIMQLRLACNSPHNFYWPWNDTTTPDRSLITSSGKLLLLDTLLPYLFAHDHKVLIFSQFTSTLDIIESYATALHDWPICRIDGTIPSSERRQQISSFNSDPHLKLFLLSTRAGGQGINLAAADTVILFDSDWNPQQDLQAQDRAHRIGQTRPVIVYRLATRGTVEQTLLERAEGKRRLEKLVIQKGKFRSLKSGGTAGIGIGGGNAAQDEFAELARILERGDGEGVDFENGDGNGGALLLSEDDLKRLTDRSDEAYARAERGEDRNERFVAVEAKRDGGGGLLEAVKRT